MKSKRSKAKGLEAEANAFALCLLIPSGLLKREIDKLGGLDMGSDDDMISLCKTFGVTTTAMAVRMNMLNVFGKSYQTKRDKEVLRDQLVALTPIDQTVSEQKN